MAEDDGWVDVAQPKPAAADDGWVNVNAAPPTQPEGPQGGLMQTIPQGVEMISSAEGRAKLWEGVKKLPGDLAQGMIDFVKTPGKALNEGVTPEEEVEFGLNAALGTIGTASKFRIPRAAIESITPHVQEFEAGVTQPAAHQMVTDAVGPEMTNPAIGFHGSSEVIANFDPGETRLGRGVFFAEKPELASKFAEGMAVDNDPPRIYGEDSPKEIKNWVQEHAGDKEAERIGGMVDEAEKLDWESDRKSELSSQINNELKKLGGFSQEYGPSTPNVTRARIDLGKTYEADLGGKFDWDKEREAVDYAKAHGFDSVTFKNSGEVGDFYSIFRKDQIEPSAFGTPPAIQNIIEAKQSGLIGPDIPPPPAESPAAAAQRAIPSASQQGDKITMTPAGEPIDAWEQRFNRYVDKTTTPDDFKTLVKDMASQSNNFPEARAGTVAPEMVAKVAEAAGLDSSAIDSGKLRTTFRTDDEIRTVTTLLKKLGDDVQSAAEAVRTDDSPESLAAFQASIIKRDYALEATLSHTAALRAEWGRSGNALQEILKAQKGEDALTGLLKDKGRSIDDLRDIARGLNGLDREQAAKILTGMRGQAPHWFYWMWTQGLISGPFTHVKYGLANAIYAEMQRGIVTPLAAIIGKAKQLTGFADTDRVFLGEAAASHLGTIMAVPDAIRAAYQTIKTGMKVPLESEKTLHDMAIAAGEKPSTALSRAVEPNLQPGGPRWGIWERLLSDKALSKAQRIIGAPGDSASAIHTTFKVLGERANLEALAYNKTAAEGLSHWQDPEAFNQRWQYHANNATPEMLKDSVYQAYKDTFMQELGPKGQAWSAFVKNGVTINGQKVKIPGLRWAFPFNHIPINLMKATYEHTPLAVLDKDMRANIMGENGGRQQDLAVARMMVGSSAMAWFAHKYMQGQATSNYPTDPTERKDWALQGKPANSIQIGERWVSFERFGPAGDLAQLGANIGSIAHRFGMDAKAPDKGIDEAFSHAIWATVNAAANTIGNEVGFQSLRNFMDAIEDEKKGGSFAAYQTTSMLPFSSLLTQTASFMDPHMRVAKSMVNSLYYRIPELRETLLPKRDPLYGQPMENPGYHGILRSLPIDTDPVKLELERVNLHPTAPRDVIGGVKLTPEQYDRYQATAGPLVQRALTSMVNHPGWQNLPLSDRADTLRATISAMRQQAATAIQIHDPKLIQQGLQQRLDYITGKTNTPRPKRPPELIVREPAQLGIRG